MDITSYLSWQTNRAQSFVILKLRRRSHNYTGLKNWKMKRKKRNILKVSKKGTKNQTKNVHEETEGTEEEEEEVETGKNNRG